MMAARGRYLLIALVLFLFVGQLAMADSVCDFSYSNYARAVQLHDMGDYDAALRHYKCALEADPDNGIIEILIDNVHEDIANMGSAWSADSAPAVLVEALSETPPVLVEAVPDEITPSESEPQPLLHSWMHATTAIAVEREFALALDQRTVMILPVATFTAEAGEGDVPMLSLEAIRYLRYDSLEALRIYAWSRSIAISQMTVENIGGSTMLWLYNHQRHESFYSQAAWKVVAVSDVTDRVNALLTDAAAAESEADGEQLDRINVMPGVYATATSLRMWQRQSVAALEFRAAGQRILEPATRTAGD